jgi:DNA-binding Xre family transcriptional regulator
MEDSRLVSELRRRMAEKKLSARKLSLEAGFQESYISQILRSRSREPALASLVKICRVLQCSPIDLVEPSRSNQEHIIAVSSNLEMAIQELGLKAEDVARELNHPLTDFGVRFGGEGYPNLALLAKFGAKHGIPLDFIVRGVPVGVPERWVGSSLKNGAASKAASAAAANLADGKKP